MRKILTTLLAISATLIAASSARADLSTYEGFDYPNAIGNTIALQNGGMGWAAAWLNGSGGNRFATNVTGNLTYSTLPSSGNMLMVGDPALSTTTASPQRSISTTFGALAAGASGHVWVSMLYQNLDDSVGTKAGFRQANLGLFQVSSEKLALGSPNTYTAGLSDSMSMWFNGSQAVGNIAQSAMATPRGADPANTVFIVVRLDLDNTTAFDSAYAWFNPDLSSEPSTATAISLVNLVDLSGVNSIRIQAGNSNTSGDNAYLRADEIRVGTGWADMMAVPEPSTMTVFGLGLLAALLRFRKH